MATTRQNSPQNTVQSSNGNQLAFSNVEPGELSGQSSRQPSICYLRTVATDIKDTLSAAIADLRIDIRAIADRVQTVEKTTVQHDTVLHRVTRNMDNQTLQLRDLQRHLEDLENRGCRHNLRVRGLPESVDSTQLDTIVTNFFNDALDRPLQTAIEMEQLHRALRTRGKDTDPPRDLICCLVDFKLK